MENIRKTTNQSCTPERCAEPAPEEKPVAIKYDGDKPDITLVPYEAILATARPLHWACNVARKYNRNNWRQGGGMDATRTVRAALSHIHKWVDGEDNDDESGLCHLDHAMASLAMAVATLKFRPEADNRGFEPGMVHWSTVDSAPVTNEKAPRIDEVPPT